MRDVENKAMRFKDQQKFFTRIVQCAYKMMNKKSIFIILAIILLNIIKCSLKHFNFFVSLNYVYLENKSLLFKMGDFQKNIGKRQKSER